MTKWIQVAGGSVINLSSVQQIKLCDSGEAVGFRVPWGFEWIEYPSKEKAMKAFRRFTSPLVNRR